MPDPKGLFEAIASDLEAVGFTINPKTAGWRTGLPGRRGRRRVRRCGSSAGPATGSGPTTSCHRVLRLRTGPIRTPSSPTGTTTLKTAFDAGLAAADDADRQAAVGRRRRTILAADIPTVPLVLEAARGGQCRRQGLRRRRRPERAALSRSGSTVVKCRGRPPGGAAGALQSPGAPRAPGGRFHHPGRGSDRPVLKYIVRTTARGDPRPVRPVDHPVRLRPPPARRPGRGHPRPARDARARGRSGARLGLDKPLWQQYLRSTCGNLAPGRPRHERHQQPAGRSRSSLRASRRPSS